MKTRIIWIASYPKSGNTWVRYLLSNYFFNEKGIFNDKIIQNIQRFPSDIFFDPLIERKKIISDIYSSPPYWIKAQENIKTTTGNIFLKTHNAMCKLKNYSFTNEDITAAVLYIVRDPRDIVVSYSKFIGDSYDRQNSTSAFNRMYGKDAQFIDVTSVMSVSKTMNKKFLEK